MRKSLRNVAVVSSVAWLLGGGQALAAKTTETTTKTTETSGDGDTRVETESTTTEEDGSDATPHHHARRHGNWIINEYGHHDRPMQLDISLGLFYDGLGVAAWYALPIVPDGFIRPINDSFDLEFGLVFGGHLWGGGLIYDYGTLAYQDGVSIAPAVGGRWNFFLTPAWSVFVTLKFGWQIGIDYWSSFAVVTSVGGMWHFNDWMGLRLEAGYPLPISVGLSFDLGSM